MHHCLTDHQTQVWLVAAAAGICAVIAGLLVGRRCRPEEIERLVELVRAHPDAGEWRGLRPFVRSRWRFLLVVLVVVALVESVDVPWQASLILGVLIVPLGLADLTLVAHARAVAAGGALDEDWRDLWVMVTRGWTYLIGAGVVVAVGSTLWALTAGTC